MYKVVAARAQSFQDTPSSNAYLKSLRDQVFSNEGAVETALGELVFLKSNLEDKRNPQGQLYVLQLLETLAEKGYQKQILETITMKPIAQLFNAPTSDLQEAAGWLLEKLAQNQEMATTLIGMGITGLLGSMLKEEAYPFKQVQGARILATLGELESLRGFLWDHAGAHLVDLVKHVNDPQVRTEAAWAVETLSRSKEVRDIMFPTVLTPLILLVLDHTNPQGQTEAARALGNLALSPNLVAQDMKTAVAPLIHLLKNSSNPEGQIEAARALTRSSILKNDETSEAFKYYQGIDPLLAQIIKEGTHPQHLIQKLVLMFSDDFSARLAKKDNWAGLADIVEVAVTQKAFESHRELVLNTLKEAMRDENSGVKAVLIGAKLVANQDIPPTVRDEVVSNMLGQAAILFDKFNDCLSNPKQSWLELAQVVEIVVSHKQFESLRSLILDKLIEAISHPKAQARAALIAGRIAQQDLLPEVKAKLVESLIQLLENKANPFGQNAAALTLGILYKQEAYKQHLDSSQLVEPLITLACNEEDMHGQISAVRTLGLFYEDPNLDPIQKQRISTALVEIFESDSMVYSQAGRVLGFTGVETFVSLLG